MLIFIQRKVDAAKSTLFDVLKRLVENEYAPIINYALVHGVFSEEMQDAASKTWSELRIAKRASNAKTITVFHDVLLKDPLFWAIFRLSDYTFANPMCPPLSEIMQVVAETIITQDDKGLEKLQEAYFVDIMSDLAVISSIISTLQAEGVVGNPEQTEADLNSVHELHQGKYYRHRWSGWADVFDPPGSASRPFVESKSDLDRLGQLLKTFSTGKFPPKTYTLSQRRDELQTTRNLQEFWECWYGLRSQYLSINNSISEDDIRAMPEMKVMNAFDKTAIDLMEKKIEEIEHERVDREKQKKEKRKLDTSAMVDTFTEALSKISPKKPKIELSRKQTRAVTQAAEGAAEQERVRVAALAVPQQNDEDPPPKITVPKASQDIIAQWWPYQSGALKQGRITFTACMSALLDAGLENSNIRGSHYKFTWAADENRTSGSFCLPFTGNINKEYKRYQLLGLGNKCEKKLRWSWDTFSGPTVGEEAAVVEAAGV